MRKFEWLAGFRGEVAAGDAEIIAVGRIHVKRGGALAKNEPGGQGAVFQREIKKFENAIFVDEGHRAIFKFDFGAAAVGGDT